ncbi:unnamed protein product [Polarella glacialis]|uniref:RRM domain-containing protein n=1 Tax=Polarella glacialis TaxID=89957 RepID=A0A813HMA6_POLGL|nr:unnamed protein product [Polarella glacialis]|mmetsp:Transcript_50578/g.82041  ORF Transcript_50578/g.82041 Transcript_50578/m.82041 type:complete len:178 (+) Transcript_50578:78-611(+)
MAAAACSSATAPLRRTLLPSSLTTAFPGVLIWARGFSADTGVPRLRVRGLPYHATPYDVATFFKGFKLSAGSPSGASIELLRSHGSRPTGQAFAYFADVVEAMKAKDAMHGQPCCVVGNRLYRLDVLEDFQGRAIVRDEDAPGDVSEEGLRDKVRKSMVGKKYQEKLDARKFLYRQY